MESLIKEKAKYRIEKGLFEIWTTFLQFSAIGRVLLITFIVGILPVYFVSKYFALGYYNTFYSSLRLEAKPAVVLASALQPSEVTIFPGERGSYSALASIKNPNLELAVDSTSIEVTFIDTHGATAGKHTGKFFILPNSQKRIVVPRVQSTTEIVSARLKISEPKFQRRLNIRAVDIQSPTPVWYNQGAPEPQAFIVEGSIFNNSAYYLKTVTIHYILYDASGKILSVSSREENTLRPFERRAYKQLWPNEFRTNVERVAVFAETDVLDFENMRLQDN